jgi:pimeloyl-ACP methyl ester carboxylesterase
VLEALGVHKAFFVGISLGGWLALKFAAAHPEKAEKLALLCPSGIGPQRASVIFRMLPLMLLGPWGEKRALRLVMGGVELSEETVEYSRLISKNFTPFLGTVPVLSDDGLRRLTMPVLLVAGEKDVLLNSRKTALRAEKLLPNAKIVLLPEAGHGLIDQLQRILPFLTETNTPASIISTLVI